jgi:hypothetical protein
MGISLTERTRHLKLLERLGTEHQLRQPCGMLALLSQFHLAGSCIFLAVFSVYNQLSPGELEYMADRLSHSY